ncbi:MAG TPA: membrane protein insertase YidC [Chitinophagales bacterium]|nr:membrane protein insertase YidC [Chitinophagales bacterium]
MDRNAAIGFVLIALIFIAYIYLNTPSKEETDRLRKQQDSITQVQKQQHLADSLHALSPDSNTIVTPGTPAAKAAPTTIFSDTSVKAEEIVSIENELMRVMLSSKGGKVVSVELKAFKTYDQQPLILFDEKSTFFNYAFFTGTTQVGTDDILFTTIGKPFSVSKSDSNTIVFRAYATANRYIEERYTLKGNSYLLNYQFNLVGMDSVIRNNNPDINLEWSTRFSHTEKDMEMEKNYSSIYFRYWEDDVDNISEHETGDLNAPGKLQWVSFKQHFFNASLISTQPFAQGNFSTQSEVGSDYVKKMSAQLVIPFDNTKQQVSYPMQFYFGPNNYQELKRLGDYDLEQIIPLGAGLFGAISSPINKFFIIPLFNFLNNYFANYGLIILIMTVLLRIILFPLNYRSFLSAAKMRVLKPEIDELKEKYKEDQTRFGQEQLKLFRSAGVNPLGGCIPALLQLPILAAMYTFFPLSIELRQQSLWWTKDLSTYDSVLNLGFAIPFYGDHVSLWTIIMTITSILFAIYNNQLSGVTGQMKYMAYIFPVMLLGIFNNLPAALTYYYSLSNVVAFGQQFIIKNYIIDEDAIHRKIQDNKKKPLKKSKLQERLENMAKAQQQTKKQK